MAAAEVFREISDLMETLRQVGTNCLVKEGFVTLSVTFNAHSPDFEKAKLEDILKKLLDYIPGWFPPPDCACPDVTRIIVEVRGRRVDVELEVPPVLFSEP